MFSGGDSSGEGLSRLNQLGNYQLASQSAATCSLNTRTSAGGSIDWASLAQQWIQMRDFSGSDIGGVIPDAPPPPNISGMLSNNVLSKVIETRCREVVNAKKKKFEEHGEADMEMDDEDDNTRMALTTMESTAASSMDPAPQQLPPNWLLRQSTVPFTAGPDISQETRQQQSVVSQWNVWPQPVLLPSPVVNVVSSNPTAHIPSLMKINIPDPNIAKPLPEICSESVAMDASKRKILPAWIREGLEKMEREKQKQMDRQQKRLKDIFEDESNSQETVNLSLSSVCMVKNKIPKDLECDSSGKEDEEDNEKVAITAAISIANIKSRQHTNDDNDVTTEQNVKTLNTGKTYEHKLSDLMIVVRRSLTELLLEVTDEEICNVSQETVKSLKNKATSANVIPKSDISTITDKLGLAAYDDCSDDTSGSETDASVKNESFIDSEEDIKANIRTKRRAFVKTSEEIEERIAESVLREEQKLKYYTQKERQHDEGEKHQQKHKNYENQHEVERRKNAADGSSSNCNNYKASVRNMVLTSYEGGKGYEKQFGETPDSNLQFFNGKRQKERTTRFSDNKDSKSASIVTAADYISHLKSNQIETAAQKINSVLLQIPVDDSCALSAITSKTLDAALNSVQNATEEGVSKASKGNPHLKKQRPKCYESSDDNDSSSHTSNTTVTSVSSRNSSKNSRSSSSKYMNNSRRHHKSSGSSARKSNRDCKRSIERDRDRHYDDSKGSRRRHHSSDSEEYVADEYYNSKRNRTRHPSGHRDHHGCKKRTSTRSKSRSRSRTRSVYSSSRRRN